MEKILPCEHGWAAMTFHGVSLPLGWLRFCNRKTGVTFDRVTLGFWRTFSGTTGCDQRAEKARYLPGAVEQVWSFLGDFDSTPGLAGLGYSCL